MNIYEKLQQVRVALQEKNIKKSGKNAFSGYDYFDLPDFLPETQRLCLEYKLFPQVSFSQDLATLTVTDIDKPEDTIVFTSPMSTAALKGCHEVQNLGAVETYIRRYLYMAALELTEGDTLDKTHDAKAEIKPKPEPTKPAPSNESVAADAVTVKGAAAMVMPSGKFKGQSLAELYKNNFEYVQWYMDAGPKNDISVAFNTLHEAAEAAKAKKAAKEAEKEARKNAKKLGL